MKGQALAGKVINESETAEASSGVPNASEDFVHGGEASFGL